MSECRNPECRQGYTPGVVASGKGTAMAPVIGASMRWGWVNCLACNVTEAQQKAGAKFKHVHRGPGEIAERARLADTKATYVPAAPKGPDLAAIAAKTPAPTNSSALSSSDATSRLLSQVEKLTDQVSELLEENRALRRRLEEREDGPVPSRGSRSAKVRQKVRKKGVRVNGSPTSDEDE